MTQAVSVLLQIVFLLTFPLVLLAIFGRVGMRSPRRVRLYQAARWARNFFFPEGK